MYIIFLKKEIYIKFSGIPVKSQIVWQNPYKYISVDQIHFYCIFMRRKFWQKYCLLMQKKNGFVEYHHFMKKGRINNLSKTSLNKWDPMGFRKTTNKINVTKFPWRGWDMLTIFILSQSNHRRVRNLTKKLVRFYRELAVSKW